MTTAALDETLEQAYRRELFSAGWHVARVHRIYTPRDTTDQVEILFVGRLRSELAAPLEALTAWCEANRDPIISAGW